MSRKWRAIAQWLGIASVVLLCVVLFPSVQAFLQFIHRALGKTGRLILDFVEIGLILFLIAGLLSPLEALGWWAGWYGDEIASTLDPGILVEPVPTDGRISRYVVYLDGIAQTQYQYLPEVDVFLEELAAVLPDDILIIKGIMPYSAINRPLTEAGVLSFFWRLADHAQSSGKFSLAGSLLTLTILLRNALIVSVSADQRYGPIYNQGTAQVIYNGLLGHGYQPGSRIPITLLAYSGGGQIALGSAPYLKRALAAPISVVSISGVISGNNNTLILEHLHHLVGSKDPVERIGPIFFPRRWKFLVLSYWNRAKRYGKISLTSLGAVGHNAGGGPFDPHTPLPDGRNALQQTVDLVTSLIQDNGAASDPAPHRKSSNYEIFKQAPFTQPSYYPLHQSVNPTLYRPIAPWMGRLILPTLEQRRQVQGVLFEVHHAPEPYQSLVGQVVYLRWSQAQKTQVYRRGVTKDVHFSEEAKHTSKQGLVHPERINHWQQVDPLESLAGSHPQDDVIVKLPTPVIVTELNPSNSGDHSFSDRPVILSIDTEPVQITGRFYGLVKILAAIAPEVTTPQTTVHELFRVVHFNRTSRQFDGMEETVQIPPAIANLDGVAPSTT
ncbi:MAG: CAAX protease, partial [Leptolyngbyaceae bacterium]|nr:CAAX protease [Leptolyngbyaceae bacterium]